MKEFKNNSGDVKKKINKFPTMPGVPASLFQEKSVDNV
jgi:hypothetical protein